MLVGIIVSGTFEENQKVILQKDVPGQVLNYRMIYRGMTPASDGKDIVNIEVSDDVSTYNARPRFYQSEYNQGLMREPDVKSGFMYDLYISPLERRNSSAHVHHSDALVIKKGETKQFGEYRVHFRGFDMGSHSEAGVMRVGTRLEITRGSETYSVVPALLYAQGGNRSEPATFPLTSQDQSGTARVTIGQIDADQKLVELHFEGIGEQPQNAMAASPEQIVLDVSKKPSK